MRHWVRYLKQKGYKATGLDNSEDIVSLLRDKFPDCNLICGDITSIPLEDNQLDAIISWGVIEHNAAGLGLTLKEFERVLKPGGFLFFTVPVDSIENRKSAHVMFPCNHQSGSFFQFFFDESDLRAILSCFSLNLICLRRLHKTYQVIFPQLYNLVSGKSAFLRAIVHHLMAPIAFLSKRSHLMIMGVAQKEI